MTGPVPAKRPSARQQNRRRAQRAGRHAETLALSWLRLHGYRLLERNLRTPVGEIDLVVRRGDTVAIVEVKYRPDADAGGGAVTPAQQTRLANAARWLLSNRPALLTLTIRFDVVLVTPWRLPVHIADAWRENR